MHMMIQQWVPHREPALPALLYLHKLHKLQLKLPAAGSLFEQHAASLGVPLSWADAASKIATRRSSLSQHHVPLVVQQQQHHGSSQLAAARHSNDAQMTHKLTTLPPPYTQG